MSASMLRVPAEIWLLIYEQLCAHCTSSQIPDFKNPEYEHGKSALAALSLTSRSTREVSQPVLYHCFYHYPHQNTVSKFLRTLISQPQLANHVRVLSLADPPDVWDHEVEYITRREVEHWIQVSATAGLPIPGWLIEGNSSYQVPIFDGQDQESPLLYHHPRIPGFRRPCDILLRSFRLWQQLLTVGLTSHSLTHLAIPKVLGPIQYAENVQSFGPSQNAETSFQLPKLRVLSCGMISSYQDFHWFFSQAPLLNSISICTSYEYIPGSARWTLPTPFTSVNALSMSCGPYHLGYMLRLCAQLRDLEVHLMTIDDSTWRSAVRALSQVWEAWPISIKTQLRRLRFSTPAIYHRLGGMAPDDTGLNLFPALRDFESLEILEIDQASLNVCLKKGLDPHMTQEEAFRQLPTVLPSSIQVLLIHHFELLPFSIILLELDELATAKETTLPKLSVVQIDLDRRPFMFPHGLPEFHSRLPLVMNSLGVVNAMKDAGIDLRFGLGLLDGRGILPPVPGDIGFWSS